MPMDGHGVLGLCAPRACAIATAHADSCDYTFANEQNIKESMKVYQLLGKEKNLRLIYRYGQHHGLDDITTYFDFFDRSFGRTTGYAAALSAAGKLTADSELAFPMTWLTPAGFDWDTWNRTSTDFGRTPPLQSAKLEERVSWMLALGDIPSGGELAAFSMGATYGEESEGASYIPGMMYHDKLFGSVTQQAFSFGDYLSGTASWPNSMPTEASKPQALVIWLHPYAYNTGYSPQ